MQRLQTPQKELCFSGVAILWELYALFLSPLSDVLDPAWFRVAQNLIGFDVRKQLHRSTGLANRERVPFVVLSRPKVRPWIVLGEVGGLREILHHRVQIAGNRCDPFCKAIAGALGFAQDDTSLHEFR